MKQALVYVEALGLSGNPKYESVLDSIAADKKRPGGLRNAATRAKETLGRYKSVAEEMNKGVEQAKTNSELWAIRHRNGLAVQDSVRMRWAARDVYLHKRGPESLDVAAEVLRAESTVQTQDRIRVDGFAFLCKALGLAGDRKYTETLKHLANNATNDKLADYAERSAQYYDPQFKRVRSVHKPKKKGTPR